MDKTIEKIALTGFMGSGKSTTGRLVAQQLGWAFVDIDDEIEQIHACSASSLFQDIGEARFRAVEAQIMAIYLAPSNTVVALGGAAVDLPENQRLLCDDYSGLLIFLDGDFEVLIKRCLEEAGGVSTYRPLLHQRERAMVKFSSRREWNLANADLRVDVGSKSCEVAATEIAQIITL